MSQSESELNDCLRAARVPERTPQYWEGFPSTVVRQLDRPVRSVAEPPPRGHLWAWGVGFATACLVFGLLAEWPRGPAKSFNPAELAQSQKIYHELAELFPDRIQTVLLNGRGSQLILAPVARSPASGPLLVQISHEGECRRFITFSGQRVVLNGKSFEVLADSRGNVLVVGDRLLWTSDEPHGDAAGYTIRAASLGEVL